MVQQRARRPIRAVLFDLGGVVLGSPLEAIESFESARGIAKDFINVAISTGGKNGAFQRLERGELPLRAFYDEMRSELASETAKAHYREFCTRRGRPVPAALGPVENVDTETLFNGMATKSSSVNPSMAHALFVLRGLGLQVAALTNNWQVEDTADSSSTSLVASLFHMVLQSSVLGLRKPDPRIYRVALERLGADALDVVFLDDIGYNLKAAAALGLSTIKVNVGMASAALLELEETLRRRGIHGCREVDDSGLPAPLNPWSLRASTQSPCHLQFAGNVAVRLWGHAGDPPVLLLHGRSDGDLDNASDQVGSVSSCLASLVGRNSSSGCCILQVPDLPGQTPADRSHSLDCLISDTRLNDRLPCIVALGPARMHLVENVCVDLYNRTPQPLYAIKRTNIC